jgi:adenylate kinase family enzyme
MRLIELFAHNIKPVKLAHIQGMSDTVVIAGPNGVGKTRLIGGLLNHIRVPQTDPNFAIRLQATNEVEKTEWNKEELDTRNPQDVPLLTSTLHKQRRRANFTSSFLNFESNRTIQQVQPYNWDWNFGDPFTEVVGWNVGLTNMTNRFQEVLTFYISQTEKLTRSDSPALRRPLENSQRCASCAVNFIGGACEGPTRPHKHRPCKISRCSSAIQGSI